MFLAVASPCWWCRVRSAHTAPPTARKPMATAIRLPFPPHAPDSVSVLVWKEK